MRKRVILLVFFPKKIEEFISVTYGCIRATNSYRFSSSGLDGLVKTLVDNNHKTLESLNREIVENGNLLNIIIEMETLTFKDRYDNESIKHLKKDSPDNFSKLGEPLINWLSENDPKFLKKEFPDRWKFLNKKLANPYEF